LAGSRIALLNVRRPKKARGTRVEAWHSTGLNLNALLLTKRKMGRALAVSLGGGGKKKEQSLYGQKPERREKVSSLLVLGGKAGRKT